MSTTPKKKTVKFTEHEAKLISSARDFFEEKFGVITGEQLKDLPTLRRVLNYYHDRSGVSGAMHKLLDNVLNKIDKIKGSPVRTKEEVENEKEEVKRKANLEAKAKAKAEAEKRIAEEQKKLEEQEAKILEEKKKARLAEKKNVIPEKEKSTLDIDSILDNI